jgi:hypothetical protein
MLLLVLASTLILGPMRLVTIFNWLTALGADRVNWEVNLYVIA